MNVPEAPQAVPERPDGTYDDSDRLHELGYEQELSLIHI